MTVNFDIEKSLKSNSELVEKELSSLILGEDKSLATIEDAQKYSLLGGGKRIRAYLVRAVCQMLGGDDVAAMPSACAIEMVHAYSLIHDDLPCMDDDDYRRGKLTNHKVFGEATAVLAGDALLTNAFRVISQTPHLTDEAKVRSISILSSAAGDQGMIGGQILDIEAEQHHDFDLNHLLKIHSLKTGALIRASAKLGCVAAGFSDSSCEMVAVDQYAQKIGLAFQVIDDLLDVIGDTSALGKKTGADKEADKLTFMNFYSVDEAKQYAQKLTEEAIAAIADYDASGELRALADYLLKRTY